jgi:hypothetical protein
MTNFQELRERKQKAAEERAKARAKAEPQRTANAKEIRSRHKTMRRQYTTEEIKVLRKAMKLDLTRDQLLREEERAKHEASFAEPETVDPRAPLALAGMPVQAPPLPAGCDRDAHYAREREERLREAPDVSAVASWVPEPQRRTYAALIEHSERWVKSFVTPAPSGWRRISVNELTPYDILEDLARPVPPWPMGWTAQNPEPSPALEDVVRAARKRDADLEILRNIGLYREIAGPSWAEVSLDGLR